MKRILEIGIYRPGDLVYEITNLADVNANVFGDRAVFTGHATVKSRFKDQDFSGFYQLSKVYEKQQGRWQVVASTTARLGNRSETAIDSHVPASLKESDGAQLNLETNGGGDMKYIRKSPTIVSAAALAGLTFAALAIWQFYLFIIFRNAQGTMSMEGGTHHLWLAIGAALIGGIAGFFVFSAFLRYNKGDDLHINS